MAPTIVSPVRRRVRVLAVVVTVVLPSWRPGSRSALVTSPPCAGFRRRDARKPQGSLKKWPGQPDVRADGGRGAGNGGGASRWGGAEGERGAGRPPPWPRGARSAGGARTPRRRRPR